MIKIMNYLDGTALRKGMEQIDFFNVDEIQHSWWFFLATSVALHIMLHPVNHRHRWQSDAEDNRKEPKRDDHFNSFSDSGRPSFRLGYDVVVTQRAGTRSLECWGSR
jgi:hypothetical protein